MRSLRWVAAGLVVLTGVVALGTFALLVVHQPATRTTVTFAFFGVVGPVIAILGTLIAWRAAQNPVGALLAWVGFLVTFIGAREAYYAIWLHDHRALPLDTRVVALLDESGWWLMVAVALLLLYFPDGRLPSPRWRLMPAVLVVLGAAQQAYGTVDNEPFISPMGNVRRPWGPAPDVVLLLGFVAFVALLLAGLASALSLVLRYRRARGTERIQLTWLSFTGVALVAYPLVCLADILLTGSSGPASAAFGIVALVALPASVAVAMLRHDLYDVDRVLGDTISYAVVLLILVAAYASASFGLGLVVGRDSPAAAAGATALCALLLAPLRSRLRRVVDSRLSPPRRAALQAIADLQLRVHTEGAQPEELGSVLREAVHDSGLRIGMLVPGTSGFVDTAGRPVPDTGLVPITLGGLQIGAITASESTGPGVLRAIATASVSLVEVTRLRAELSQALREVEASRTRLVQVGDAERRRLERDLHDGAQQRLVSLGMAMRRAQRHLDEGSVDVNALLDEGVAELATAIAELRRIAHGLRPTNLDEGLFVALSALTSSLPIRVRLDVQDRPIPASLTTTAYYVAAEAITNAAKYSQASRIDVVVASCPTGVEVRVSDDGCGGATARPGSGLSGLGDRVAAIGGSLRLVSPCGAGTTVEAMLPCES